MLVLLILVGGVVTWFLNSPELVVLQSLAAAAHFSEVSLLRVKSGCFLIQINVLLGCQNGELSLGQFTLQKLLVIVVWC